MIGKSHESSSRFSTNNETSPSSGSIKISGAIAFFKQREPPPDEILDDYLFPRYSWSLLGERLLDGIDRKKTCPNLSGGQWMRARLAAIIDNQFLILDEPTNDLDREAKIVLCDFIRNYQQGILLISHDRELLSLCNDILELSNQGLQKYGDGWIVYEETKEYERKKSTVELERAKRERDAAKAERIIQVERQEKRNRQGKAAALKGGMPKILLGAKKRKAQATTGKIDSTTLEKANSKVKSAFDTFSEIKIDPVMYTDLVGAEVPNQKLIVDARNFNVFYGSWIYKNDLTFQWRGSVRLAIKGKNGSGKTTLMKAIAGEQLKMRGEFRTGKLNKLYLDQQCSILDEEKTIFDNVQLKSNLTDSEIRNSLARLLFFDDSVFQEVHTLSGGERLRAALACGLLAYDKPHIIILDEPTNNLDLGNIQFLENLVSQFRGAVIMISHDDIFLEKCRIETEFWI